MKKKILISALICAILSLTGCDKLKRDFTVKNVKFSFSAVTNADTPLRSGSSEMQTRVASLSSFTITRTVSLSEIGSSDVDKYSKNIDKVEVNSASVVVTANPPDNFTITDLTITAVAVAGSAVVPSYTIGNAFTAPSGLEVYIQAFVTKLVDANTIAVTVTGRSDAPAGTTIHVTYESSLLFTASLL